MIMAPDEMIRKYSEKVEKELKGNILPFWVREAIDWDTGGFHGHIRSDLSKDPSVVRSLVLCARLLWTFSRAYRLCGDEQYSIIARMMYSYLNDHFLDPKFGGYYWHVDAAGVPQNTCKELYGQFFALYGMSEYYKISGDAECLERCISLFRLIEQHGFDPQNNGYFDALSQDWSKLHQESGMYPSLWDQGIEKSMNVHLHMLEAYAAFASVWQSVEIQGRLRNALQLFINYIIDPKLVSFRQYFDREWNDIRPNIVSLGHDIEGSWLLYEAAEILGDESLLAVVKDVSVKMAQKVYEGRNQDGGIHNETDLNPGGKHTDTHRVWWAAAESAVGYLNAYQLSQQPQFIEAFAESWDYIEQHFIDTVHGEWFGAVLEDGTVVHDHPKVSPFKCPYHNGRACFEILERFKHI